MYNSLPEAVHGNWVQILEAFNQKYANANNLNWLKEHGLLDRVQGLNEIAEASIADVRQKRNQLTIKEPEKIILRGLFPPIKAFVIGQQPANLEELEMEARLA